MIELRILKREDYPEFWGWAQWNHKGPPKREVGA